MANRREMLPLSRREIEEDLFATQYQLVAAMHEVDDLEATKRHIKRAMHNIEGN